MKTITQIWKSLGGTNSINKIVKQICGEQIGSGQFRDVYVLKDNPKYVVKIERDPSRGMFINVQEWTNFINHRYTSIEKWLAPCEFINETGQIMVQRRVVHKARKFYPTTIPYVFTDLKLNNFGWIGKRFVACDYPLFIYNNKKKTRYAKWRPNDSVKKD